MDATVIVLLSIIVIGLALLAYMSYKPAPAVEHQWLVTPDDDYLQDNERLIRDDSFVKRVASVIELRTGCQCAPDKDLIRVYKNNKMVGIVKCVDGRKASPALVGEVVDLAQHLKVKTMYLATQGPVSGQTRTFAGLQKVKLISL
jgi:hypothetical protein